MAEEPSAPQEALSKLKDQLSCLVCLEPYTNPKLLSCFHIYCQHCLEDIVAHNQQGQLECPKCHWPTLLPPTGVNGLQAAFHIHYLFDIQETLKKIKEPQNLVCEKCSKTTRKATSFCRQCTKFICDMCTTMHNEWEDFEGHDVVSIETVEGDLIRLVSPKKISPFCPKHNESAKLFCEPCGELICIDCIIQLHKDHKYCVIADAFESHKKEIKDSLGPLEEQLEATNTALFNLDSHSEKILEQKTTFKAKFEEIRHALNDLETELTGELEGHTQQKLKTLSAQRKEIEILQTQRSTCLDFVRESFHTESPGDVLKMKQRVVKQVKELVDTFNPNTLEPRETANTCFVPSVEMVKSCKEFGAIYTLSVTVTPTKRQGIIGAQRASFRLSNNDPNQLIQIPSSSTKVKLLSGSTDQTTKCVVKEQRKREYENCFQPILGKAQQLHVRVGEEEMAESSFLVAVKTPINKLGTIVRFIEVFKSPWGVAVNKRGEVIVAESDAGVVSIFSPTGDKPQTLDTKRTVVGEVKNLRGVALDGEDNILVVDRGNHRLLKFSRKGDLIAALGSHGDGPIQFSAPYGVCVNSVNGKVYVVDRGTHCVIIINSDLTFSSKFGSYGNGEGQFDSPWDVTSDRNGCVYVADFVNDRVQVFTPDGGYLRQFGKRGNGKGELNGPASTCVNNKGLVYVGESINQRVSVFTCEGVFVKSFGSLGSGPGQFKEPLGIAVDQFGVVYVSDHDNDRVQMFY